MTRLVGSLKNSIALSALRSIQANSFSRHTAMPGRDDDSSVWRARKKLVSIILNLAPQISALVSAAGTSGSCMKRSEEHTSELQSLMRISYAVFCLKKKKKQNTTISRDYRVNKEKTYTSPS